jgi:hypothetical protein
MPLSPSQNVFTVLSKTKDGYNHLNLPETSFHSYFHVPIVDLVKSLGSLGESLLVVGELTPSDKIG